MKTKSLAWIASIAAFLVAACAAFGFSPVEAGHTLSLCVDWIEGFTGHMDGMMLAEGAVATGIGKELKEKIEQLIKTQKAQFEELEPKIQKALKAGQGVADLTEQFEKANGDVAKLTDQIKDLQEKQTAEVKKLNDRQDEFEKKYGSIDVGGRAVKSPGRSFVESEAVKSILEQNKSSLMVDRIPRQKIDQLVKTVISSANDSGLAVADSLRLPGVVTQPNVSLNVQQLLPRTVIDARAVDYVRESGYTSAAAPVAESQQGALVTKPESEITFELLNEAMKTIAHWIPASKQILMWSNRVQLQSYIDGRLRYGLDLEVEDQVLTGTGVGQDLNGLIPNATAYNRGYAQIQNADPTKIDTLRRAMTQARLAEYPVTGMVLHPGDWEDITLTKGSDLHYIFASPGQMTVPRLWGVPVADSTRMTEGSFLVGAFAQGAELFIGMEATVAVGTEHASFFIQNMVAILAELMALLAIYRPEAFITGDFEQGTGS